MGAAPSLESSVISTPTVETRDALAGAQAGLSDGCCRSSACSSRGSRREHRPHHSVADVLVQELQQLNNSQATYLVSVSCTGPRGCPALGVIDRHGLSLGHKFCTLSWFVSCEDARRTSLATDLPTHYTKRRSRTHFAHLPKCEHTSTKQPVTVRNGQANRRARAPIQQRGLEHSTHTPRCPRPVPHAPPRTHASWAARGPTCTPS